MFLEDSIRLENGVQLDFQGNAAHLLSDVPFLIVENCQNARCSNVRILTPQDYTTSVIHFLSTLNGPDYATSYNLIEDIWITEIAASAAKHVGTPIFPPISSPLSIIEVAREQSGIVRGNTVRRVFADRAWYGILFSGTVRHGGFCNMNRFESIFIGSCRILIAYDLEMDACADECARENRSVCLSELDHEPTDEELSCMIAACGECDDEINCNENTFEHCLAGSTPTTSANGQTIGLPSLVASGIVNRRNSFSHVGVLAADFGVDIPKQRWSVHSSGESTVISGIGAMVLKDEGTATLVVSPTGSAVDDGSQADDDMPILRRRAPSSLVFPLYGDLT